MKRFRQIFPFLLPGWATRGDGELIQYTEGVMLDAFQESCHQTAKLMLPSVCVEDALDRIGADRGIPRGFAEPEASYRERLRRWRYPQGHRIRGNAPGLLEQIAAVFGDAGVFETIDARGTRYTHGSDGAERGVTWDWDGSTLAPNWARFYVVLAPAGASPHQTWDEAEASGMTWDEAEASGWSWASPDIHPGQLDAVRTLCQVGRLSWTPAGRRPVYCVVQREGESYPAPDGTWDEWPSRPADTYAFFSLHDSIG